jgi:hypothetical protein
MMKEEIIYLSNLEVLENAESDRLFRSILMNEYNLCMKQKKIHSM